MTTKFIQRTASFLAILVGVWLAPVSRAADISWNAAGSGFWTNAASWSPAVAPSNNPNVNIANAGSKTVTIDAATPAANLTITNLNINGSGANNVTLLLSGNSTPLNVLGALGVTEGTGAALVVDGGQLVVTNGITTLAYGAGRVSNIAVSNGGSFLAKNINIGGAATSRGTLTVDRSTLGVSGGASGGLNVGGYGIASATGFLFATSAQLVTTNGAGNALVEVGNTGVGTMTVSNSTWLANQVYVGDVAKSIGMLTLIGGTNLLSSGLIVGNSAGATGSVLLAGGQLVTTNSAGNNGVEVGNFGVGTMTVSNSTWLANQVYVGYNTGAADTLTLIGGTNLFSNNFIVGNNAGATGSVLLASGQLVTTNSAGNSLVGVGSTGVGTMTVSNSTWLANRVYVGDVASSIGTLTIIGGTNLFSNNFIVGNSTGSTGSVLLASGQLVTTNSDGSELDYVGNYGVGSMTVSNGTWLASQVLVGYQAGSRGTLTLAGGTNVFSSLAVSVWNNGNGTVWLTGGQLVTTNSNGSNIVYMCNNSGVGSMTVSNGAWLADKVAVGSGVGSVGTLTFAGGTNWFSSGLAVGYNAGATSAVSVTGGNLAITNVGGTASLTVGQLGRDTFTLNGGTVTADQLLVANGAGSTFTFNGGILNTKASTVNNGSTFTVGDGLSAAALNLLGGTNSYANGLRINTNAVLSGSGIVVGVVTNAGSIHVFNSALTWLSNVVLNSGSSYLSQSGTNTFNSGLTIASGVSFNADAASLVSVLGNYQNLGSSIFSNRYTVAGGSHYKSWGGSTNQFVGGLTIASGGGLDVTNGASVIGGTITNTGTMTVFNAQAIYNGNVVNQGAYVSDPSTNTFNGNFTVGPTATVVAAANDIYAFGSNFVMQSTNRAFDMSVAKVVFADTGYGITTGNTNHTFDLTGSGAGDKGSNWLDHTQLATNFSIGTLTVALGNRLTLAGSAGTNALYVGVLDLSAWSTNAGVSLTNTLQAALNLDINLYYDKYAPNNAYLQGVEFGLWGGGGLLIPIPEPSPMLAVGTGLALLAFLRRKAA